jgi:hypothetical protein
VLTRGGKRAAFIGLTGDIAVTTEMPLWYDNLGRCAYGGVPPRTGGPWRAPGRYGAGGSAHGPGKTPRSLGVRRMGKAWRLSGRQRVDVPVFELEKLQFFE